MEGVDGAQELNGKQVESSGWFEKGKAWGAGGGMTLPSGWNEGKGLKSIAVLPCFVFRCTNLFSSQENQVNV